MRESVTADDLAIESAKQKLVELAQRDEYKAAIAREQKPQDRGAMIACATLCIASTTGAVALGWLVGGLAWIAVTVLGAFATFMGLGWLAISQEGPSEPFGVAVVGKHNDKDKKSQPSLELLRSDGERIGAVVNESLYGAVRPGDVGVAWIRKAGNRYVLTELERL